MKYLWCLLLFLYLSGCTQHIIHQRYEVSRDYTYIDFSRTPTPYTIKRNVGGEHSTFIKILGFEGDMFSIEMKQDGDATFNVYGEGILTTNPGKEGLQSRLVTVEDFETIFTIEISALIYGDYFLKIAKH